MEPVKTEVLKDNKLVKKKARRTHDHFVREKPIKTQVNMSRMTGRESVKPPGYQE